MVFVILKSLRRFFRNYRIIVFNPHGKCQSIAHASFKNFRLRTIWVDLTRSFSSLSVILFLQAERRPIQQKISSLVSHLSSVLLEHLSSFLRTISVYAVYRHFPRLIFCFCRVQSRFFLYLQLLALIYQGYFWVHDEKSAFCQC